MKREERTKQTAQKGKEKGMKIKRATIKAQDDETFVAFCGKECLTVSMKKENLKTFKARLTKMGFEVIDETQKPKAEMVKGKSGYYRTHRTVRRWKMGPTNGTYLETSLRPWIQQVLADVRVDIGGTVEISDGVDINLVLVLEGFEQVEGDLYPCNPTCNIFSRSKRRIK